MKEINGNQGEGEKRGEGEEEGRGASAIRVPGSRTYTIADAN